MKKALLIIMTFFISCQNDNLTDTQNNRFESVYINSKFWMKENLDVEFYHNGDPIPHVQDSAVWANLTYGAWCYYNNDPSLGAIYGKLYNWYAVNDPRGLAPEGWHIANASEWTLLDYLSGRSNIKSRGTIENGDGLWYSGCVLDTFETGFNALPAGHRNGRGEFLFLGYGAIWWFYTGTYSDLEDMYSIWNWNNNLYRQRLNKRNGLSVRCVKN